MRNLVMVPDEVLYQKAAPVEKVTPEIRALVGEMRQVMEAHGGAGLAAPQVGESLRVVVYVWEGRFRALINPQIISRSVTLFSGEEGCLSIPDLRARILRHEWVTVTAQDERGKKFTLTAREWEARILQHEIDHLDGRLIMDVAPPENLVIAGV